MCDFEKNEVNFSHCCYSLLEHHLYLSLLLSQLVITLVMYVMIWFIFLPLDCKFHEDKKFVFFTILYPVPSTEGGPEIWVPPYSILPWECHIQRPLQTFSPGPASS